MGGRGNYSQRNGVLNLRGCGWIGRGPLVLNHTDLYSEAVRSLLSIWSCPWKGLPLYHGVGKTLRLRRRVWKVSKTSTYDYRDANTNSF